MWDWGPPCFPQKKNYNIGNQELLAVKTPIEEWRHCLEETNCLNRPQEPWVHQDRKVPQTSQTRGNGHPPSTSTMPTSAYFCSPTDWGSILCSWHWNLDTWCFYLTSLRLCRVMSQYHRPTMTIQLQRKLSFSLQIPCLKQPQLLVMSAHWNYAGIRRKQLFSF